MQGTASKGVLKVPEYIERKKVIELINNYGKEAVEDGVKALDPVDDIVILAKSVELIPAVHIGTDKLGQWAEKSSRFGSNYKLFACSVCGWTYTFKPDHSYCPCCGAFMKGGTDNG